MNAKDLPQYDYNKCPAYRDEKYVPLHKIIFCQDSRENGVARYRRSVACRANYIKIRGEVPSHLCEPEECIIPTQVIAANPVIKTQQLRFHGEEMMDEAIYAGEESIDRLMDVEMLKDLHESIGENHTLKIDYNTFKSNPNLLLKNIVRAMGEIVEHELLPAYIVMNPAIAELLYLAENKYLFIFKHVYSGDNIYQKGTVVFGTFRDVPILTNCMTPKKLVFLTSSPYKSGIVVVKKEPTVGDVVTDQKKLQDECVIDAEVGFGILEDYANAQIMLTESSDEMSPGEKRARDIKSLELDLDFLKREEAKVVSELKALAPQVEVPITSENTILVSKHPINFLSHSKTEEPGREISLWAKWFKKQ